MITSDAARKRNQVRTEETASKKPKSRDCNNVIWSTTDYIIWPDLVEDDEFYGAITQKGGNILYVARSRQVCIYWLWKHCLFCRDCLREKEIYIHLVYAPYAPMATRPYAPLATPVRP